MTAEQLYKELHQVDHSKENRLKYANIVISQPNLIPEIIGFINHIDDTQSARAAWLLEFVAREQLEVILPYLDSVLNTMPKVYLESAVRPMAKICEYLIEAYYDKSQNKIKKLLQEEHKEKIAECCFDWMINDHKIAPKAYSMNVLFLLGQDYNWIHPELKLILERDYHKQTAGFKARARHILQKIKAS